MSSSYSISRQNTPLPLGFLILEFPGVFCGETPYVDFFVGKRHRFPEDVRLYVRTTCTYLFRMKRIAKVRQQQVRVWFDKGFRSWGHWEIEALERRRLGGSAVSGETGPDKLLYLLQVIRCSGGVFININDILGVNCAWRKGRCRSSKSRKDLRVMGLEVIRKSDMMVSWW